MTTWSSSARRRPGAVATIGPGALVAACERDEPRRLVIDQVARDPADGVTNGLPLLPLAGVLGGELVVLRSVDLDDQPASSPDEVGFLTGDPRVHGGGFHTGIVEQLERTALGVRAGALVGQQRVSGDQVGDEPGPVPPTMTRQGHDELLRGRDLQPQ